MLRSQGASVLGRRPYAIKIKPQSSWYEYSRVSTRTPSYAERQDSLYFTTRGTFSSLQMNNQTPTHHELTS